MLSKFNLLFCCIIISLSTLWGQVEDFQLVATINKPALQIELDKLQQLYLVLEGGGLEKYNAEGQLLFKYNQNNLGSIQSIDVSNPHQILVFYAEYQTLVLLDRSLSEIRKFNLADLGYLQVEAVAMASDNHIWVYDPSELLLQKIDRNGAVVQESPDLSTILDDAFMPNRLMEQDYQLFLNDPDYGIMLFDVFGNYQKTLNIKGLHFFQWQQGYLQWVTPENKLQRFHLNSFQVNKLNLERLGENFGELRQLCQQNQLFIARYPQKIIFFKI